MHNGGSPVSGTEPVDPAGDLSYRLMRAGILRAQLLCARLGVLDVDWRTALLDATAEAANPIERQAAADIANLPDADWEPDMKVGWRRSLESWFAAMMTCIDDMQDAHRDIHRTAAGMGSDDLVLATYTMDRDVETASYRAGLTAAGMASAWEEWLRDRVLAWAAGPRRNLQLAAMSDPEYRRQLQQLPRYWV